MWVQPLKCEECHHQAYFYQEAPRAEGYGVKEEGEPGHPRQLHKYLESGERGAWGSSRAARGGLALALALALALGPHPSSFIGGLS